MTLTTGAISGTDGQNLIVAGTGSMVAAGINTYNSGITKHGTGTLSLLARVHLPMLRVSLFTAAALAFVDIMKEMPITLMTRPFGWDTLAVKIFELTSEGEFKRAALPALALVVVGTLPIALLSRSAEGESE